MPTTKVEKPAARATVTAWTAAGESSACADPLAGQLGMPSVASTMNFGFGEATPERYAAAAFIAARVGVWLPLVRPPLAAVRPATAALIAAALPGAIGTAAFGPTPQVVLVSAKNLSPQ